MDAWDAFRLSEKIRLDNYSPTFDELYELAHTDLIELDHGMRVLIQAIMSKQIRVIELFGGIGVPAAALRRLGIDYRSIDYVEIDEKAVRSYNEMFKDELKHKPMDVRDYRFECDLMVHGSPCQDFSIAGHQKGG